MDTKEVFDHKKSEGWINLICGSVMFSGAIALFFYFVSGCSPKDIPENLHPIVEETTEAIIENVLGLEEGTIEIDLTPGDKEGDEGDDKGDEKS